MTTDTLKECTVEGNVVKLPPRQLDRNIYLDIKKALELIGGKWKGGKVQGFVFPSDPSELLSQISNGEKRNLKKEYQFFGTPEDLADEMVNLLNPTEEDIILEPSAGQGALVKAINKILPNKPIFCCELMDVNREILSKILTVHLLCNDFLELSNNRQYSKIIANPPFSKNQDIDHIYKMYELLQYKGRLVTLASNHWRNSSNKKETKFREFLDSVKAEIREVESGTFKESGTSVSACLIKICK